MGLLTPHFVFRQFCIQTSRLNTKHQPTEPAPHIYHTNNPKRQHTGAACTGPQNHTFVKKPLAKPRLSNGSRERAPSGMAARRQTLRMGRAEAHAKSRPFRRRTSRAIPDRPPRKKTTLLKGTMTGTGYTSFTTFFSFYLPTSTLPYHPPTHNPPKPFLHLTGTPTLHPSSWINIKSPGVITHQTCSKPAG